MGAVLDSILAVKKNLTGGAFEALTPGTGDTFTIRDYVKGSNAYLLEAWGLDDASPCQFSIASPRMNDAQLGLRLALPSGAAVGPAEEPQVLFPGPVQVPVYNADTLRVRADGTAADNVLFDFLIYYEDLDGSSVPFVSWLNIVNSIEKIFGILTTPTAGSGNYGAPVTLDSTDDRLEADKRYALLGATCDLPVGVIGVQGPDTGRYRVTMPGKVDPTSTGDWFVKLSAKYGLPLIPVIKSNNSGSTLIDCAQADSTDTVNVTLILAQLAD
jgi:hypothetical protein